MHFVKKLPTYFFLAFAILTSCNKENEFEPYLKGDIVGNAYCFDEYGNPREDFSGINVYTLPDRQYHAITNEDGRYELKNLINGTYDLSFEKEGFGTMILHSIKHLGGKPTVMDYYYGKAPFIYQHITTRITDTKLTEDVITINPIFTGSFRPWPLHLQVYFSTNPDFNPETAQVVLQLPFLDIEPYYTSHTPIYSELPFKSGDKVFYKASIYSTRNALMLYNYYYVDGADTYIDYESNKTIYPNLSDATDEYSFTMP